MTTIDDRPATEAPACPSWCAEEDCQEGIHCDAMSYVPASGGTYPAALDMHRGAQWPAIAVSLDANDDRATAIGLWVTAAGRNSLNVGLYLRPHEARELVEQLQKRLDMLDGKAA